jgi:putative aminopeptidase FrvX
MVKFSHPTLQLVNELLDVPAPSGGEGRLAEVVRAHVTRMGYRPETDPAGNISVRVGAETDGAPLVLAAHMDEIAMVVHRLDDVDDDADGDSDIVLRVRPSGGLHPAKIGEGPVEILGTEATLTGVLSMGSAHTAGNKPPGQTWDDLTVLTGRTRTQLAEAGVGVGTALVPVRAMRGPFLLGDPADPLAAAWTFDDRAGVATLLRLLERLRTDAETTPARPLVIAFTVDEEVGCQGAKVLCRRVQPEIFVAIDGCPMPPDSGLKLDGRPGVWSKDRLVQYDRALVATLCACAEQAGTALQVAVYAHAASDASAVYDAGLAPRVAHIGHVRENSHGYEVLRLAVLDHLLETLVAFVKNPVG